MKFVFAFLLLLTSFPAAAVEPDEILPDPALEARARVISRELRCLVCQGEDIDDSAAPLAADIRRLVRERLMEGDSDAAVLQFVQSRYGDYVLQRPPLKESTWLLWTAPFLILSAGCGIVFVYVRRQKGGA